MEKGLDSKKIKNGFFSKNKNKENTLYEESSFVRQFKRNRILLLMLVPAVTYFLLFSYLPMTGSIVAFKNYNFRDGIAGLGVLFLGMEMMSGAMVPLRESEAFIGLMTALPVFASNSIRVLRAISPPSSATSMCSLKVSGFLLSEISLVESSLKRLHKQQCFYHILFHGLLLE